MTARFKELTVNNWLEPDETLRAFGRLSPITGPVHPITAADLASSFLAIELGNHVPENVVAMFKVARGTLLYGYFFYPLYAVGQDQLWRVCEAAMNQKFQQLDGPRRRERFVDKIKWMRSEGHLSEEQDVWWTAVRQLRNSASHPVFQTLIVPLELPGVLQRTAHAINCLFDDTLDFMSLWRGGRP
ncbi:MAG TPA: hypothetical protein VHJ34_00930 [Actinomycetota bacterium]|nr:hypothetical protein [Actinomycetota bacterium]